MTDEAALSKAKNELLRSVSEFIEKFYTAPGSNPDFDWAVKIARHSGEYTVLVQAGFSEQALRDGLPDLRIPPT